MARLMRVTSLALCLLAASAVPRSVLASTENGGTPGDWLTRYASSRSVALGGAMVANSDEPLGVVWNPAGLSAMYQNEAGAETARLFEGTSLYGLSVAVPAQTLPSVGITFLSLQSGGFERTNELNEPMGTFGEGDLAFLMSASKRLGPNFAVGTNVKVIRQTVEDYGGTGFGGDLGVLYDATDYLRLGASINNLGGPNLTLRDTQESYPSLLRGGFSLLLFRGHGTVSAELDHASGTGTSLHAGTEYWLYPQVGVRLGWSEAAPAGGLSYRFPSGLEVRYGLSNEELGFTHRIGLSYRFGGFFASSEADPPVFSPLGRESVTKFLLKAHTKAGSNEWALDITDKSGRLVRRFSGKGSPPPHVMWDGKDEAGLPLADGTYAYVLSVRDDEGHEMTSRERAVEITTAGPQGAVPVLIN